MNGEIADEVVLSQFGNRKAPALPDGPFRCRLREEDTDGVSMLNGRHSPDEACRIVTRLAASPDHGVRYTTAGTLRAAGFHVKGTPSRRNKLHVSVIMESGEQWTDEVAARFDSCFNREATVWGKEET